MSLYDEKIYVQPNSKFLISSLRSIGYSLESSLADLIDNCISASATNIEVELFFGLNPCVSIADNGTGMSAEELLSALSLGVIDPNAERPEGDLGRFGMGLKTASFAHCRSLRLVSKKKGETSSLVWDLDIQGKDEAGSQWALTESDPTHDSHFLESLDGNESGTVVIWEKLDRTISSGLSLAEQGKILESAEKHLSMIFHRFLGNGLNIAVNGHRLCAWDPFFEGHPAKPWISPTIRFPENDSFQIQCHVMPSESSLTSEEIIALGGKNGLLQHQGIYIYRNDRMLTYGGWLDLGKKKPWRVDNEHSLARVCIDIKNSDDDQWSIDIQKAVAKVPFIYRAWLSYYCDLTRKQADKYRGKPRIAYKRGESDFDSYWQSASKEESGRYRINRSARLIDQLMTSLDDTALKILSKTLVKLEEQLPVERVLSGASDSGSPEQEGEGDEVSRALLEEMFTLMVEKRGMTEQDAIRKLLISEPFNRYPRLIEELQRDRG